MDGMFLGYQELVEYTGRTQKKAQNKVLDRRGIPHDVRADGMPIVLREYVFERLGLKNKKEKKLTQEPNLEGING